jgi:hypothetical protein
VTFMSDTAPPVEPPPIAIVTLLCCVPFVTYPATYSNLAC